MGISYVTVALVVALVLTLVIASMYLYMQKHIREIETTAQMQRQQERREDETEQLQLLANMLMNSQKENNAALIHMQKENNSVIERRLAQVSGDMAKELQRLAENHSKETELVRNAVGEKLDTTLNQRLSQSFNIVNERLEQVYKGLGEMQNLAAGVGDLKKVLSNVKTRGIVGEVQLAALLQETMTQAQYKENIATVPGSRDRVEFALVLPGTGEEPVYLPIDAKFPGDLYSKLVEAYEDGNKENIELRKKELAGRIREEAKSIAQKYVSPPSTTDFAVLFLPFEGLYAEVINLGLVEELNQKFKVTVAGPSTMLALINSLQLGFRTLAIQQQSREVWRVLDNVRTEFSKFADSLDKAKTKMDQAGKELDSLIGTRTRQMQRQLDEVGKLNLGQEDELGE